MSKQRITLHFSNTDTTTLLSTLNWLTSHLRHWSCSSDLELVVHHVSQTLVVDDSDVNICMEFLASDTRIHWLIAMVVIPSLHELMTEIITRSILFVEFKRCAILRKTMQRSSFTRQRLDEHADRHTRRESVGIDDDIWLDSRFRERHVDTRPFLRANTLLSVTRGEFITDDWGTGDAELDRDRLGGLDAVFVADEADFFDEGRFAFFVFLKVGDAVTVYEFAVGVGGDGVPGADFVALLEEAADIRETVFVDLAFDVCFDFGAWGEAEQLLDVFGGAGFGATFFEFVFLDFVYCAVAETTFVCGFVDNHSVVHVVAGIRNNCDHSIHAIGEVVKSIFVVKRGADDWCLSGLKSVGLVVCSVSDGCTWRSHGLFAHLTLVHVSGGLVEV